MQKAVFPIQSHADITKAINFMHINYNQKAAMHPMR